MATNKEIWYRSGPNDCREYGSDEYGYAAEVHGDPARMVDGITKMFIPIYQGIAEFMPPKDNCPPIVDMGSGVGNFARMLLNKGYDIKSREKYIGIEFSSHMLAKAQGLVPECTFVLGDLREGATHRLYGGFRYGVFLLIEVLEHIEKDIDVLESIPGGGFVIFSVPNFLGHSHVRCFESPKDVMDRYGHVLAFLKNKVIELGPNKTFAFQCIRRY